MKFSIIIPSFNQAKYIEQTLLNVVDLKNQVKKLNHQIEVLLFDNESNDAVLKIISKYESEINYLEIAKDKGQYDAINKGIAKATGDYWTWLNTDDTLHIEGITKLILHLSQNPKIDYVYGSIDYIDEDSKFIKRFSSYDISYNRLVRRVPGIFQQGSFFKKEFTNKIGILNNYNCCFDYEYVLRVFKNNAVVYVCDYKVANFRQHKSSKTGNLTPIFIKEQLAISALYGREVWHFLTWFSHLRLLKHSLFPRK
jgi:glycosyltransferase involved in cell wall biosynthesis